MRSWQSKKYKFVKPIKKVPTTALFQVNIFKNIPGSWGITAHMIKGQENEYLAFIELRIKIAKFNLSIEHWVKNRLKTGMLV